MEIDILPVHVRTHYKQAIYVSHVWYIDIEVFLHLLYHIEINIALAHVR